MEIFIAVLFLFFSSLNNDVTVDKSFVISSETNLKSVTDSIELALVKSGTFNIGCTLEQTEDCFENENPIRRVTLKSYYIGKHEITQAQWREVMGTNPSKNKNCDLCPVEQVSWNDIQKFLEKLNKKTGKRYRLPTEAEWEFAARGRNGFGWFKFSGSNNIDSVAYYDMNCRKTNPVGMKKPNKLGIYDMSGNVSEWCSDKYDEKFYQFSIGDDPIGPLEGSEHVIRGGSWFSDAGGCRVSFRDHDEPDSRSDDRGFRLAMDLD